MPYYELIYETGAHSIAFYDDDEEALSAVSAHHQRAMDGVAGGPTGHPAERVKTVLVYDEHPATYGEEGTLSADEVSAVLKDTQDKNGVVNVGELIGKLRDSIHPMVESGAHESNYKLEEARKLKWGEK